MRIAVYDDYRIGVLGQADNIIDVTDLLRQVPVPAAEFAPMAAQLALNELILAFDRLRPAIEDRLTSMPATPIRNVTLRAPLPRPGKIMCMGVNYKEGIEAPPRPPLIFVKPSEAVLGPGETFELPNSEFAICHHEAELAVVIGRGGRHIDAARAMTHVFGYTCAVDVSCRGSFGGNSFIGKSFDGCCPVGPYITTTDEVPDPYALRVRFWVGDQPRHDYLASDMDRNIAECIQYISSVTTLLPGDLILLGTNHQGIGPLQDGDSALMEVSGLGALTFQVADSLKRSWPRQIDEATATRVREMRHEQARIAGASVT
jgi:2-keto-4-pentenoate hydratase/2-oxohepta-3-ene-1,7-dioic acid hydratase in catechol pathway